MNPFFLSSSDSLAKILALQAREVSLARNGMC